MKMFALLVLCTTLFSFAAKAGGDTYKVYIGSKLVFTRYVYSSSSAMQNLQIGNSDYNNDLIISYNHCGKPGNGRSIAIKDEQGNTLKEWKFADDANAGASMSIPVKDILELEKKHPHKNLNVYYYSSQYLPKGIMLTSVLTS